MDLRDLELLILSRYPIIAVGTYEEERVEAALLTVAVKLQIPLFVWTVTDGLRRRDGGTPIYDTQRPIMALANLASIKSDGVYLFGPTLHAESCRRGVVLPAPITPHAGLRRADRSGASVPSNPARRHRKRQPQATPAAMRSTHARRPRFGQARGVENADWRRTSRRGTWMPPPRGRRRRLVAAGRPPSPSYGRPTAPARRLA